MPQLAVLVLMRLLPAAAPGPPDVARWPDTLADSVRLLKGLPRNTGRFRGRNLSSARSDRSVRRDIWLHYRVKSSSVKLASHAPAPFRFPALCTLSGYPQPASSTQPSAHAQKRWPQTCLLRFCAQLDCQAYRPVRSVEQVPVNKHSRSSTRLIDYGSGPHGGRCAALPVAPLCAMDDAMASPSDVVRSLETHRAFALYFIDSCTIRV